MNWLQVRPSREHGKWECVTPEGKVLVCDLTEEDARLVEAAVTSIEKVRFIVEGDPWPAPGESHSAPCGCRTSTSMDGKPGVVLCNHGAGQWEEVLRISREAPNPWIGLAKVGRIAEQILGKG